MTIDMQAVRVAAAAAALVEDRHRLTVPAQGGRDPRRTARKWWAPLEMVLDLVRAERQSQTERWGDHPRDPLHWLMALAAEAGPLAASLAAAGLPDPRAQEACSGLERAAEAARHWLDGQAGGPTPPA